MPRQDQQGFDRADPLGCDLAWPDDLDATHRLESGISCYVHDIFGRITCPNGRLVDDEDFGIDVVGELLHRPLTPQMLAQFPRRIEAEISKDPRTDTVAVTLTKTGANAYRLEARGTCGGGQPYRLVAAIADAEVRMLED